MTAGDLVAAVEAFLAEDHPERCPFEDEIPETVVSALNGEVFVRVRPTHDGSGVVVDAYTPWGKCRVIAHGEHGFIGPYDPSSDSVQPADDDIPF